MVTAGSVYNDVKKALSEGSVENYIFEARCITGHVFNISAGRVIANPDLTADDSAAELALKLAGKRISGYPLQYILEEWEFFGLPFRVGEGVLIPRQDTETLVECVLNHYSDTEGLHIADLCSGSGCIPVALDKYLRSASISAVEYSDAALAYLNRNIALNSSSVKAVRGDVLSPETCHMFSGLDIITSNPPYLTPDDMNRLQKEVSFEPEMALAGGNDGLLFYRTITANWKHCLKQGGMIFYETGIHQDTDVSQILAENGFTDIKQWPDLCGVNRVVSGVYNGN